VRRTGTAALLVAVLYVVGFVSVLPPSPEVLDATGLGRGFVLTPPPHRPVAALRIDPVVLAVVVGLLVPVPFLRRHAPAALACVLAAFLAATVLDLAPMPASYAVAVALAGAARWAPPPERRRLVLAVLGIALAAVVVVVTRGDVAAIGGGLRPGQLASGELIITFGALALAWWVGTALRRRDEHAALLAERARQQRRIHELEEQAVREEERLRIARDLHDSVGHVLTAVPILAAALRRSLPAPVPAAAEQALAKLEEVGAGGAADVRRALHELRDLDRSDGHQDRLTSVDGLTELVDHVRRLGHPVDAQLADLGPDVPRDVRLAVHRIVQESLTNVVRHAPGAAVHVLVGQGENAVEVIVTDEGGRFTPDPTSDGKGLVGMRERTALLGGTLEAGPRAGASGWSVRAVLPVDRRTWGQQVAR
jgi:signal transduction histidine kinase